MCDSASMGRLGRELTRRDLLRAFAFGSAATGLAACGLATSQAPSSGSSARGSASAAAPIGSVDAATSSAPPAQLLPTPDQSLTIREKIGQLLVVGFRGLKISRTSAVGRAIAVGEL